jgi:cell division protein FtsB
MLRYEIKKEINSLQVQLEDLEDKTSKMDKLISYLKTDEYIEKQARLELNLSRPGEKQINLVNLDDSGGDSLSTDKRPNVEKWFNYFFD